MDIYIYVFMCLLQVYYVLFFLIDGIIIDMDQIRDVIVYVSGLFMFFIIVGVGEVDFSDMNFLDGDNGILKGVNGRFVLRDIVQFVFFRDFKKVIEKDQKLEIDIIYQ